jgi:hypothetical protein
MTDNDYSDYKEALKDPDYFLQTHNYMRSNPIVMEAHALVRAKRVAMRDCCVGMDTFSYTDYSTGMPDVLRTECWKSMQDEYTNTFRSCFAAYTKWESNGVKLNHNEGGIKLKDDSSIPDMLFWSKKRDGVRVRFYGDGHTISHKLKPQTPSVFGKDTQINLGSTLPTPSEAESQVRREILHSAIKTYKDALQPIMKSTFMFDAELICTNPRGSDYANGDKMYPAINTASPTWELMIFDCFYLNGDQKILTVALPERLDALKTSLSSPGVGAGTTISFAEQTRVQFVDGTKQSQIADLCQSEWAKDKECNVEGLVFRGEKDFWSLKVKPTGMYTVVVTGIQPSEKQGNLVSATLDFDDGPIQISVLNRSENINRTGGMNVYITGYARNPINIIEKNTDDTFYNDGNTKWGIINIRKTKPKDDSVSYTDWALNDALGKLAAAQDMLKNP